MHHKRINNNIEENEFSSVQFLHLLSYCRDMSNDSAVNDKKAAKVLT